MDGLLRAGLGLLSCFLVLSGCSHPKTSEKFVDPTFQKLIPDEALSLAGLDISKLKESAFYRSHDKQLNTSLLESVSQNFGFDLRRDLAAALLVSKGKEAFVALHGKFEKNSIEQKLERSAKPTQHAGNKVFQIGTISLSILTDELAIAGPGESLSGAIETFANGTAHLSEAFEPSFQQLSTNAQIWSVSRGGLPFANIARRTDIVSLLSNFAGYISATSTGAVLDSGLHLNAQVDCLNLAGAKRVDDGLRGGIGLARLAAENRQPDLFQTYQSMRVQKQNNAVHLDLDIPAQLLESLLVRLEKLPQKGH
jgi:hypothetical protein